MIIDSKVVDFFDFLSRHRLQIAYIVYALLGFVTQLVVCLRAKKISRRILPLIIYPGILLLLALAGHILGNLPGNSLLGWLIFIALIALQYTLVALAAAWLVYGIVYFAQKQPKKQPKKRNTERDAE